MKLIYIFLDENYKNIEKGVYPFDNEFAVEKFDRKNKIIKLNTNDKYHKPFNNSIQNITCIVGKNGIGKTTFFELLIAPLIWRLDGEELIGKLHLLFYDKVSGEFLIESYINNADRWQLQVDDTSKIIKKNKYQQNTENLDKNDRYSLFDYGFSVLPFQTNIIFHSLSPFDRIYSLIKQKLTDSSSIVQHYYKRFKYIGIKQIENEEISYEYMTTINLMNLFFNEDAKKMINDVGYKFKNIKIDMNSEYFNFNVEIPSIDKLNLDIFNDIKTKYLELEWIFISIDTISEFDDKFFNNLLLKI